MFIHHYVIIQLFLSYWVLCKYEWTVQLNFVTWFTCSDTERFASKGAPSYLATVHNSMFVLLMFLTFVLLVGWKITIWQMEVSWFVPNDKDDQAFGESFQSNLRKNKSYETLVTHHNDKFVQLRIQFFKYLAKKLKLFLLQFQSDRPVVSFLSASLEEILCVLMKAILK